MNVQRRRIGKSLVFVVVISVSLAIVYLATNLDFVSQDAPADNATSTDTTTTPEFRVDLAASDQATQAETDSKDLDDTYELFSDAFRDASVDVIEWADNFYNNPDAEVTAERYRFVHIDYELLHRRLKQSPAYLAAIVGQSPPPIYDDSDPSFSLTLFNNRRVQLLISDVQLHGEPEERYFAIRGELVGGGRFKLSTTEGQNTLSGQIDTQESHTRIDTLNGSNVTSVAEFDRHRMESSNRKVD